MICMVFSLLMCALAIRYELIETDHTDLVRFDQTLTGTHVLPALWVAALLRQDGLTDLETI